ncbi:MULTISPECIES: c-type cytochrome biogenesis protein CcmI [unclassified Pseudomonas]|uniref:c-type cytochrome biogenesis protein CcmI n=1 Tax=unclassified Pseudomonas TaxID=196821 RepID=UPI0025F2BE22|nr:MULTISPECIES: c-type cytochrome biogenesis protein CcmI [unclassified Pseudomonas]
MIDFWLATSLLLLVALSFLLIPLVRGRRAQREEDRTALNVALYQERLTELQQQQAEGVLSTAQMDSGRAEAARELLADTEEGAAERVARLGKPLPVLVAVLVPVVGLALYLHFGASDKVELTREFSQPPGSLAQMTDRLERAVKAQPDSAQSLYFLARTYMAQDRPADAARMFERAVAVAGRQAELLGQWAQALYFAGNKAWTPQIQGLADEALKIDPNEVTSLGLKGINAFESRHFQEAVDYWKRLLAVLPPTDPSRSALEGGIAQARDRLVKSGGQVQDEPLLAAPAAHLKVRVTLSDALRSRVQPGDTVFVFARAVSGPPAPLAVKRVKVADLPVEVELTDADAMMPELKLSNFPEVQLVARVSRAGQPTAGEWIGRSPPLPSNVTARQALTIDSPDQ